MHFHHRRLALATTLLCAAGSAAAGFELISRTGISAPMDSNGDSMPPTSVSADGRFALFSSSANNLVAGDSNRSRDLFLHDAAQSRTTRVSVGSGGVQADGDVGPVGGVSNDGRFVVFDSSATNLGGSGSVRHVYLHDRELDTTVALTQRDPGHGGDSANPRISGDGRYVVFDSYASFSDDDSNSFRDIYRYDRQTSTFELVSRSSDGRLGNADSFEAQISADGGSVGFHTWASNLVPGDTNGTLDVLLKQVGSGQLRRASVSSSGAQLVDYPRLAPQALSADGRYVLLNFQQPGTPDDSNGGDDGFRFDSHDGSVLRVTLASDGTELTRGMGLALSADGLSLLLQTSSSNAVPGAPSNGQERHYLRHIADGTVTPVSYRAGPVLDSDEFEGGLMAADGSTFFASSRLNGVVDSDRNNFRDAYRLAGIGQAAQRLSAPTGESVAYANGDSGDVLSGYSISGDGRYVVFASLASNLVVGDLNGARDVFLRDRLLGTTRRISLRPDGSESTCTSQFPAISANGRYVAFNSCAGLAGLQPENFPAIYRIDLLGNGLELVSALPDGAPAHSAWTARLSADGNVAAFWSCAAALAGNGLAGDCDIYVRDLVAGTTLRASPRLSGNASRVGAYEISPDGRFVVFDDGIDNLVAGDSNGQPDVFLFDRQLQTVERVSLDSQGAQLDGSSQAGGISANGRYVAFSSTAAALGGGSAGAFYRGVFLRDRVAGTTTLSSLRSDGTPLNGFNEYPSLSADGQSLAFLSRSTNGPDFPGGVTAMLYVYERTPARLNTVHACDLYQRYTPPQFAADGRSVAISTSDDRLSSDDGNGHFTDVFVSSLSADPIFRDGFQASP